MANRQPVSGAPLVDAGLPKPEVAVVAQPVESFRTPQVDQQAAQLIDALSRVAPALGALGEIVQTNSNEKNRQAGLDTAAKLYAEGKKYGDEVRAGRMPANKSPFFMAGLREQEGRLQADRFYFDFLSAYGNSEEMQTTTDPAAFDNFQRQFYTKWQQDHATDLTQQDPYFLRGFASKADAAIGDVQREFASSLPNRALKTGGDAHFQEVFNSILTEVGRHSTRAALSQAITAHNDDALARGLPGAVANKSTIDAVVGAAKALHDVSILDLLDPTNPDSIKSGPANARSTLGSTRYAVKVLQGDENQAGAYEQIAGEVQTRQNRDWTTEQHEQANGVDNVLRQVNARLSASQDPYNVDLSDLKDQMNRIDPSKVALVTAIQQGAVEGKDNSDNPQVVRDLYRRVFDPDNGENYTSYTDAAAALQHRDVSRSSYTTLLGLIADRESRNARGESDPLKNVMKTETERLFADEYGANPGTEVRWRQGQMVAEMIHRYLVYRQGEGKGKTEDQVRTWIHQTIDENAPYFFGDVLQGNNGYGSVPRARIDSAKPSPSSQAAPQPVDPKKQLVTDSAVIRNITAEVAQVEAHRRSGFSSRTIEVLRRNGIPPKLAAIKAFLQAQTPLLH
jgi:hypothetical protein